MKKFLTKFAIFCSILFLVALGIDLFLTSYFRRAIGSMDYEGEIEVVDAIYNHKMDIDLAVYGSSRACIHIDPTILEDSLQCSSYNLGIDGAHFRGSLFRHKEYLNNNPKPKIILYSLDYNMICEGWTAYNYKQYLPFMLWRPMYCEVAHNIKVYKQLDVFLPLVRYRHITNELRRDFFTKKKLKFYLHPSEARYRKKGYLGLVQEWYSPILDNANFETVLKEYSIIPKEQKDFEDFLDEMKEKGILVVLVYSPEHILSQKLIANSKELLKEFEAIAKRHHIPFLNYADSPMCLDKKYFYNGWHLNRDGSQTFSKQLAHDLCQLPEVQTALKKQKNTSNSLTAT